MTMRSIYVIIDTSSYINMSAFEYRFGTLLSVLAKEVILRHSSSVNGEIANPRHWHDNMPTNLERSAQVYYPQKYTYIEYERRLFDKISESKENKGEKENFAITLDLILKERRRNLIFLMDDDKALNPQGCLEEVVHAFPLIKIWNSFDAVLFLYFLKRAVFPYEIADEALKVLHKQTLSDDPDMDPKKMQKKLRKLEKYRKSLERIRKIHE